MEENNKINIETESPETQTEEVKKSAKKPKSKKLKNQALLRRGGYSIAITAAVLIGVILLNMLVSMVSDKLKLEFDISGQKISVMTKENIECLKEVDKEVNIIVCAEPETYATNYMGYYAENLYGITEDATQYYKQTIKLLDKYPTYNDKITLDYIDTQDTRFTEVAAKYAKEDLAYGDIIVTCTTNGVERYKIIGFADIYNITEDETYAQYGYVMATVTGNNVESAVTGAITYVTSDETKNAVVITGHSRSDYTGTYQAMLKSNNYEVDVIPENIVTAIDKKYDVVIIAAPTVDFIKSEIEIISNFLENDGKMDKGLVFIADVTAPYLPNFYSFLEDWGIKVESGILFETNAQNYMPEDPTTLGSYPESKENELTENMTLCITGNNVPMLAAFDTEGTIEVTPLITTPESVVAAPAGTAKNWTGADNYEQKSYVTAIQSSSVVYDEEDNKHLSYVMAFSSVDFIFSEYSEQSAVSNKDMVLSATNRAAHNEGVGVSFIPKTITIESYTDSVTESSANVMRVIFMIVIPVIILAVGIYVFIRRKNA